MKTGRYYPRRRASGGPKRKYAKRVYKRKTVSSTKGIKSLVKKMIRKNVENKTADTYAANTVINCASSILLPTYISLAPTVTAGTSAQNRIGNEITVTKSTIRGICNVLPYNVTTNPLTSPIYVKMWLCSRKNTNSLVTGLPALADFQNFFQSGSTSLGWQINILDTLFYNNRDYWNVHTTKTMRLQYQSTISSANAVLSPSGYVTQHFTFNLAKHLGRIKYNDASTQPSNKELFLVFQAVLADGSTAAAGTQLAEVHYVLETNFEDA